MVAKDRVDSFVLPTDSVRGDSPTSIDRNNTNLLNLPMRAIADALDSMSDDKRAMLALVLGAGHAVSPAAAVFDLPPIQRRRPPRLLRWGRIIRDPPQYGTLLHYCAFHGRTGACAMLLDSGLYFDPDARLAS